MKYVRLWNGIAGYLIENIDDTHINHKFVNYGWCSYLCWMADCYYIERNKKSMLTDTFHNVNSIYPFNERFKREFEVDVKEPIKVYRCRGGNIALNSMERISIDFACGWFKLANLDELKAKQAFSKIPYYDVFQKLQNKGFNLDDKMIYKAIQELGMNEDVRVRIEFR